MKQKPPYYTVDHETRRFLEMIAQWAQQLDTVQQTPTDINHVVNSVCDRFGLELESATVESSLAEVVPLRPFRVITTNQSEPEDEPR